jgi:rod shape-determining protein MreD
MTEPPDWERWRRRLLPAGTVAAGTLITALPMPLAWPVLPHAALGLLLLWASVQPALMPVWAAFLLGLFHDMVAGLPLGLSGLLFPLAVVLVRTVESRLETMGFGIDWTVASLLIAGHQLAHGMMLGLFGLAAPWVPMVAQAVVTILAWPLLVALAAALHRRLADEPA